MTEFALFNLSGSAVLALLATGTFLLSMGATKVARRVMKQLGVIDIPNHRSSHSVPVIRGGGIGPAIALVAALGITISVFPITRSPTLILLVAVIASALLGWLEDRQGVPVRLRLGAQVLIGSFVSIAFIILFSAHWAWSGGPGVLDSL